MDQENVEITYDELGCYVGRKAVVLVSKSWLDSVKSTIQVKKECSKCKKNLPLEDFNQDKRRLFGKRSQCRPCYKDNTKPKKEKKLDEEPKIEYTLTQL
jgi:hypothetical protein